MALQDSGILISLKITQWSARKLDRSTSFEVCNTKHADQDSGTFNKQIIPKKHLKEINQLVNKIRNYHYANTLAWTHKGADLLPTRNYLEYTQHMSILEEKFNKAVNNFTDKYNNLIQDSKNNLNDLYDLSDYPSIDIVKSKFTMQIDATPIPTSGDFRIDIGKKELDKLKEKLKVQLDIAQIAAEKDLFSRLYTALVKAVFTLNDPNKIFRNTLIFNIENICKKIPNMNINNNKELEIIAAETFTYCNQLDLDILRTSEYERKIANTDLKYILNKVDTLYEKYTQTTDDKSKE